MTRGMRVAAYFPAPASTASSLSERMTTALLTHHPRTRAAMRMINVCIHQNRAADVVEALVDAGFRNISLQDLNGGIEPLNDSEQKHWVAAALGTFGIRLSMVCDDDAAETVTKTILTIVHQGEPFFAWIHVGPMKHLKPAEGIYPLQNLLADFINIGSTASRAIAG